MNTPIASTKRTGSDHSEIKRVKLHGIGTVRKALLVCGIISSLYYVAINIIVPLYYPGYNAASQAVSELSAIDAPTRQLWTALCTFYSLLVIAFCWGIWLSAGRSRQLQIAGLLMLIYGISGFFWPPMHQREVIAAGGETMTDTMHIVFTIATVLLMMLMMGFGAAALGKHFRLYTIACFILFVVFGTLTGLEGPKLAQGLPTSFVGVWERINIGIFLLWVILFAISLLQKEKDPTLSIIPTFE